MPDADLMSHDRCVAIAQACLNEKHPLRGFIIRSQAIAMDYYPKTDRMKTTVQHFPQIILSLKGRRSAQTSFPWAQLAQAIFFVSRVDCEKDGTKQPSSDFRHSE